MAKNWTTHDLSEQYDRAKQKGWLAYFYTAASAHSFDVELLLAIASRETNMRNIEGDYYNNEYHGFGIMQVDRGTDPAFAANFQTDKVEEAIEKGTQILDGKRSELNHKGVHDLKAVAAAYNTGAHNVLVSLSNSRDPDST